MKSKKTPMRLCIGCGEMRPKRKLVRVLKAPDDTISLDITGKKSGRGAYLCKYRRALPPPERDTAWSVPSGRRVSDAVYEEMEMTANRCWFHLSEGMD